MQNENSGKVALVTGGTSGIGAATAVALSRKGYTVFAGGLNPSAASFAPESGVQAIELDVTDPASIDRAIGSCERLDVLVNCAGTIVRNGGEFIPENFERVIDVNLHCTMRCCLAAREKLEASRGSIVNIASMLSFFGGPLVPAYTASKGGVAQLTKSYAVAWGPKGIRVNAVAPGWIATEFTSAIQSDMGRSDSITARTPLGRWGQPDEIADVVVFLTSHEARFISGIILPVDGGYLAC
jgi:NAD(P)-dependent dehydrogenase (short-subunit alcohol dehydrogenase family)